MSYIESATKEIAKRLRRGQLVVLKSTTWPGTTEEFVLPRLERNGLKVGEDFFLAFAPERIDPGNKEHTIKTVPKVVGGVTKNCTILAASFFKTFIDTVHPVSSPRVAEMSKLLENIYRLVNISLINELTLLSDKMKIDIWEVIEAAKTKPHGFHSFNPSPRAGGHCIPLDPFYLSWKAREHNFFTRFIELAGEINEQMPHFVVTKVIWALNLYKKPVRDAKILVLGVTYKKDVADTREAASHNIIWDLLRKGAKVSFYDPHIKEFEADGQSVEWQEPSRQNLKRADCVLILTDHSGVDYEKVAKDAKLVVDTRNVLPGKYFKNVIKL